MLVVAVIPGVLGLPPTLKQGQFSHCQIIVTLNAGCHESGSSSVREASRSNPTRASCGVIPCLYPIFNWKFFLEMNCGRPRKTLSLKGKSRVDGSGENPSEGV